MVLNDPLWCAYNLLTYTVISNVFQFLPSTVIYTDLGQQRPCCASHYCQRLYEKIYLPAQVSLHFLGYFGEEGPMTLCKCDLVL